MKHLWLAIVGCLAIGCGGGHQQPEADAGPHADAGVDAAPDDTGADIATTLVCGPTPQVGSGGSAEFQLATIDTTNFPDALCNDGTPAVLYFRPYSGEANRNKWVLNLHGGGSCGSGPSCAARWCNCSDTKTCPYVKEPTNFNRLTMTNASPPQKAADGVFHRGGTGAQANPIGDYNQVEFTYCSSDAWQGSVKGVSLSATNPVTGEQVTFKVNFLGAKILDADLASLRQDGVPALAYTLDGKSTAMPDLDDADEVIVTGDSAGGAGVIQSLDLIAETLKAHNASPGALRVYGLIDAIVGIERSVLDYSTYYVPEVHSYDEYLTLRSMSADEPGSRKDASCLALHAADPRICADTNHVIRHHVTTPFFVRMALRDSLIGGGYVAEMLLDPMHQPLTINSFALRLHDELTGFAQLSTTAEEGDAFTKEPGVFGPACTKHDTIHENGETFSTTITPPNGTPQRVLGVFDNWRTGQGTPTNILTESTTLADTNCP
jgi:hypothetical protein